MSVKYYGILDVEERCLVSVGLYPNKAARKRDRELYKLNSNTNQQNRIKQ